MRKFDRLFDMRQLNKRTLSTVYDPIIFVVLFSSVAIVFFINNFDNNINMNVPRTRHLRGRARASAGLAATTSRRFYVSSARAGAAKTGSKLNEKEASIASQISMNNRRRRKDARRPSIGMSDTRTGRGESKTGAGEEER